MEKTYTQKVHFKFVIEGDYSCGNLWEEELYENAAAFGESSEAISLSRSGLEILFGEVPDA